MKALRLILGLMMVVAFLSSCSKDEDPEIPVDKTPTLTFKVEQGFVSGNATMNTSTPFKVGIIGLSNTNTNAKLVKLTITRVFNDIPASQDTTFSSNSLNVVIDAVSSNLAGQENWFFEVKDKDGYSKKIGFTITTTAPSNPIETYSMKIMGAQGSSTGSSFASVNGEVYSLADAKTNAVKIDWLYFYGATNMATLASPKDNDAASVFNDPTNGLATWSVRNNTLFKKVSDAINWDNITNDEVIVAQTASGVTETKVNTLAANNILAFITESGKKGLIRVESITGTNDGTIKISVKVQK